MFTKLLYLSWTQKSITPDHNCLSGCFCSWISLLAWSSDVLCCGWFCSFSQEQLLGGQDSTPALILLLVPSTFVIFYLLAHLLFLVLSSESFLLVWSSRQWKGNCLDQLSSIYIFQRHHLSLKSIHSFSRTQNNLWSNSFVFSILKQKCFMPSTHLTASERCMCPGFFASHTFTCRIPASLAANATLLSVAFADVCEGSAAISSCSPGQPPAPYCLPLSLPASCWGSAVPILRVSAVVWVMREISNWVLRISMR